MSVSTMMASGHLGDGEQTTVSDYSGHSSALPTTGGIYDPVKDWGGI